MGTRKLVDGRLKEFFILQIKTTKEIIQRFSNTAEFSPTMLLNSLLSLVVLPFEKAKKVGAGRSKIFPGNYKDLEKKLGFTPDTFQPIKECKNGMPNYQNKTIYAYINKFRNGIAHQNINVAVDENKVIHISIFNKFYCGGCKKCPNRKCREKGLVSNVNGVIDFQITVTVNQLQKLAIYIADKYLKAIGD